MIIYSRKALGASREVNFLSSFYDSPLTTLYSLNQMQLIVDGYNLLHVAHPFIQWNAVQLQRERDHLIDQLSAYRSLRQMEITIVFDGWQGGWSTEQKEKKKGVDIIFSKIGEKADEVIKRMVRERGSAAVVVTSDREISKYAERMNVAVIPSDQFNERLERVSVRTKEGPERDEEERGRGFKRKGPSRMLSKKEKRMRSALRKL